MIMNKQIAVVTLLIGITVIATAYDFDDPVYNQILANEFEELESSIDEHFSHVRTRRDEAGPRPDRCGPFRGKKLCCGTETYHKMHEDDRNIRKQCFKESMKKNKNEPGDFDPFSCERMERHKKAMVCMAQCTAQKKDWLDSKGNLIKENITKQLKAQMAAESWYDSIENTVIQTCFDEAKNTSDNPDDSDPDSCNPAASKLMHCLFKEIQMNCPAEAIKDQKACTKLREKILKHGFMPMPPPMPHDD